MTIHEDCRACREGNHNGHAADQPSVRQRPVSVAVHHHGLGLPAQIDSHCLCIGDCAERKRERDEADEALDRILAEDELAENEQLVQSSGSIVGT